MKIRSKLAWTFIILLIAGITSVSSYSILFIRDYLLRQGLIELQKDTQRMAVTVSHLRDNAEFQAYLNEAAESAGYQVALYDSAGSLIYSYPVPFTADPYLADNLQIQLRARGSLPLILENDHQEKVAGAVYLSQSINPVSFIKLSQFKERIYQPIQKIRWIIYYGMFISIGLIIIVSIWISRYLTKPITQIKDAAQAIAGGDVDRNIDLNRNDEFGNLADSLNHMADKLRLDTEQIKEYAGKQRRFFADITHEIRNPLHTISASLEMVQIRELSDEKREKYYKNAQNQVERISRLFKDLKTLQRYDSDEHFLEQRSFNLSLIGKHMQEWYAQKAGEKGLALHIDTESCEAYGDPGKIEQVVDNLISNAIKYTHEGSVSLNYKTENGTVLVEVKDSGTGISKEHLSRLFDRFYRTDKARSRDKGGTGLGLAVAKSILLAHGSELKVESSPGEGSLFYFRLKQYR